MVEIAGGEVAELGGDEDVLRLQGGERGLHVLLGEDAEHLSGDAEDAAELLAGKQGGADVHRDDDVGAHLLAGSLDRQVAGQHAVDQDHAAELRRGDRAGHRHAGTHHVGQLAVAEHHGLAGDQVGGHGTVGNGQVVELVVALGLAQPAKHGLELDAGDDALAELDLAVVQADLGGEQDAVVVLLATHGALLARRVLFEQQLGGDGLEDGVHFRRGGAGRVGGADQGPHAGAGDAVDRHAVLFEHLDHPDMRRAPRAAAGEDQADPWPFETACRWGWDNAVRRYGHGR
ncbi:hypothetical protein D9M71_319470 [compost metagenome]